MQAPSCRGITTDLRLTVLTEGRSEAAGLATESHGAALWIEAAGRRILFGTGDGSSLLANAERLGIAIAEADAIVLSHGHRGHCGGLPAAIGPRTAVPVYLNPGLGSDRRRDEALDDGEGAASAPVRAALARSDRRVCHEPTPIVTGIWATGPVPYLAEDPVTDRFTPVARRQARALPSVVEQALVVELEAGSVICTGCCHPGVQATILAVQRSNGGRPIAGLVGGLHLAQAGEAVRLRRLAAWMAGAGIARIATGACTGALAESCFASWFGDAFSPLRAGQVLEPGRDAVLSRS